VAIVSPEHADAVLAGAGAAGIQAWRLGRVVRGSGHVDIQHAEAV